MKRLLSLSLFFLLAISLFAQTNIGGAFANDTTLTRTGNPYLVNSNLFVPDSVTLTVDDGVELIFSPNTELRVEGELISHGTAGSPVEMRPPFGTGVRTWNGVIIIGTVDIRYTEISLCEWGLDLWSSAVPRRIERSKFLDCRTGFNADPGLNFELDTCDFIECTTGANAIDGTMNVCYFRGNRLGFRALRADAYGCEIVRNDSACLLMDGSGLFDSYIFHNFIGAVASNQSPSLSRADTITMLHNKFMMDYAVTIPAVTTVLIHEVPDSLFRFKYNSVCSDTNMVILDGVAIVDLSENCWCGLDSVQIAGKIRWWNTTPPFNPYIFTPYDSLCVPGVVYPGDCDFNQVANARDLLPIGLNYNQTGPVRPNASTNWTGQPAPNWNRQQANGRDLKHVDCNGDGTIDLLDVPVIILNYGQTHQSFKRSGSFPLDLRPRTMANNYLAGDTVIFDLFWGNMDTAVQNAYGLIFSMQYDTSQLDAEGVDVEVPNSWLGTPGSNLLSINHHDSVQGYIDLGIVRTDGMNASGFGRVASIIVVIDDDISKREIELQLSVADAYAVDATGEEVGLSPRITSPSVSTSTDRALSLDLDLYPNPIDEDGATLRLPEDQQGGSYELLDLQGRMLKASAIERGQRQVAISSEGLRPGMYLLRVDLEDRSAVLKLVVE